MSSPFDGLPDIFLGAFGQAVTLYTKSFETIETRGIYRARSIDALGMTQPGAMLHLSSADAAQLEDGASVQIGDEWFTARVAEPDDKGMVSFRLEASDGP